MSVDLNNMASNIQSLLSGVPGIAAAYDVEPQQLNTMPAATLYFDSFQEREETLGRLSYDWRWTIRIYVQVNTSDIRTPQTTLRTLITNTLLKLRQNLTLNNTCMYSSAESGDVYNILNVTNPMLVAEITLTATTQESR